MLRSFFYSILNHKQILTEHYNLHIANLETIKIQCLNNTNGKNYQTKNTKREKIGINETLQSP